MTRRHDELWGRWQEHLAKVELELYRGHLHQEVWTEVRDEIQRRRPNADATFLVSYSEGYVASQLARIRRLADTNRNSHSLASLVQRIQVNPRVITRSSWIDRYAAALNGPEVRRRLERVAASIWRADWADPDRPDHINPAVLQNDLDRLANELEHITTWATKTIAHLDPRQPARVPKYHEIREALALLAKLTVRYQSLLHRPIAAEWVPTIQGDWQAVFRPALFPFDPEVFRHCGSFT